MHWLADVLYLLAGLAYLPVAFYNALIVGKNRRGWRERFGQVRRFNPKQPRIWIHAVSLGEVNATPRLVEVLRKRLPGHDIVLSTTTDTGDARAVQLYGREHVFRFPLDFSFVISRVLRRVRPSMIVLVELEVWHNLVRLATARGVPIVVVNGRLTIRSERRFARLGRLGRSMFMKLAWVGAQDEAIASRFRGLGVPSERVEVTSSLKWDSALVADRVDGADELAQALGLDASRPRWVCGSTGPGEETMILGAYRKLLGGTSSLARGVLEESAKGGSFGQPVLAIVPRKPERFGEVARLIEREGFPCIRRSERPDGIATASLPLGAVVLGDTMGELRKFYSLANVVFVGRSLVPMGGSDPMEVAALGKAIVVGPYTENFQLSVGALRAAGAIRIVESADKLPAAVGAVLADAGVAVELGSRARDVVIRNQGATERTVSRVVRVLETVASGTGPRCQCR